MTANVNSNLASWSTTESSNSPAGTDTSDIDAEFRMIQAVVRKYLATKGADIASAATVDLSSATGNYVHITGTTTVTALGTVSAGMSFLLVFDGALTFTHNATSLILPGAANITTAAGDRCEVRSLGSGNWRCMWYQKASGKAVIASAFTDVTGTAAISQGGTGQTTATAAFDALAPTTTQGDIIYHNGTDNVRLAAGTSGHFLKTQGAGANPVWTAVSSAIVQVVNTQTGTYSSGTTQIPNDNTIPQNTEGDEYMTLAITPTSATNKLKIDVVFIGNESANPANVLTVALFQDATAGAIAAAQQTQTNDIAGMVNCSFSHYMTAGTTSATTFKVRAGLDAAGTLNFNGSDGAGLLGGVVASSITITEIQV